jgi:hypothetical protein
MHLAVWGDQAARGWAAADVDVLEASYLESGVVPVERSLVWVPDTGLGRVRDMKPELPARRSHG